MKGLEGLTRVDTSFVLDLFNERSIYLTPQMFAPEGATVGDGTERALSTIYSSLGDAQAVFPFITALTQTIDYACIKAMSNEALGPDQTASAITYTDQPTSGSTWALINDTTKTWTVNEHAGKTLYLRYANGFIGTAVIASNTATALTLSPSLPYDNFMIGSSPCGYISGGIPGSIYDCVAYGIGTAGEHGEANALLNMPMFIPAGNYRLGADKWLIRDVSGATIIGAGRRATKISSSGTVFATDGFWFSKIEGIAFETTGSPDVVVDIDGNVPGHPYATRGVQGITFKDLYIYGNNTADYGLAITRLGNPPSGPGAQGSENLFLNCHFHNCVLANVFSTGFNALQNTFIGCNFQGHQKDGIHFNAGSFYLFSCGFQSTYGYDQIANDGYDINSNFGGAGEPICVIGCRTESLRFYRGSASQPPVLMGNVQVYGGDAGWFPSLVGYYTLGKTVVKTSVSLGTKLYRVTTAGTSGGDSVTNSDIFSTTTIGKTGKAWTVNQFVGWKVVLNGGTGSGQERDIISNTATTLTVATWTTTPDATTDFQIEPIWPNTGTFTDGSVVWTTTDFLVVDMSTSGQASLINNTWQLGEVQIASLWKFPLGMGATREVASDYTASLDDELLLVDATGGNRTITLPFSSAPPASPAPPGGKRYIIKKYDTSANTVTVQDDLGSGPDGAAVVIPGGSRGYLTVEHAGGGTLTRRYWILDKSF